MMKKTLVLVVAAMMATVNATAQSEPYMKHEVAVSYGGLSNSEWMSIGETLGTITVTLGGASYDDGSFTGPIGLEYFYHINPVIGLGAVGVFTKETKDIIYFKEKHGEAKNTFVTVMPAAKFNWLRKKYFGMYSKVALGVSFRSQKEDYSYEDQHGSESDSDVLFNFQVSGIGLEAGPANIRAFLEFGLGEQGMGLFGVRCKF